VSNTKKKSQAVPVAFENFKIFSFFIPEGTFNIPKGIYWSQPVSLERGFWKPFPDFPVPRKPDLNLHSLFLFSVASLYKT
ncbi:hypothetical protein, partial [Vibrio parahaemolyticus]|uniref:hypothetical protein n=1 Tax=Vibrio parahaemolyticus TaxID=670 RepID=UPI001A8E186B